MIEPGISVYVGIPGSGKTTAMRADVEQAAMEIPVLVLDLGRDWNDVPDPLVGARAKSVEAARASFDRGAHIVVVRPPPERRREEADAAAAWLASFAAAEPRGEAVAGLAIPEASAVMPNDGTMSDAMTELATKWRHYDAAVWVDTQRLALISRTVTSCAYDLHLFAQVDRADLDEAARIGGRKLADAVQDCAQKLERRSRGGKEEPGWHVSLGLVRRPPFKIRRTAA